MEKKRILELKKKNGKLTIVYNQIEDYKDACGVWCLYNQDTNELLEVGQSSDVFSELSEDLLLLLKDFSLEKDLSKKYTARRLFDFNKKFDVLECDANRTAAKYRVISKLCEKLCFYLLIDERALSDNKNKREEIEMEYAIENFAWFWNAFGIQRKLARQYYSTRKQFT